MCRRAELGHPKEDVDKWEGLHWLVKVKQVSRRLSASLQRPWQT